jgi:hypothetical protein
VESSLIAGNTGGGFATFEDSGHWNRRADLVNVTIADNHGPGIAVGSSMLIVAFPLAVVQNAVVWGNTESAIQTTHAGLVAVRYSLVTGIAQTDGNLATPPTFVDAPGGDYRLAPGSAGIDAGDGDGAPALDLRGVERIDAPVADTGIGTPTFVDLGAFETGEGCLNRLDDDGDGLADCADADCAARPCDGLGRVCAAGLCACPTGLTTESSCGDGQDDDCDGLVDCADPDCAAAAGCEFPEVTCDDGFDNDGNGAVDCADWACLETPVCDCPFPVDLACGESHGFVWNERVGSPGISPWEAQGCVEGLPNIDFQKSFRFVATASGQVLASLSPAPQATNQAALVALGADGDGHCDIQGACLAADTEVNNGLTVSFTAVAGQTYFVILLGMAAGDDEDVTLALTCL